MTQSQTETVENKLTGFCEWLNQIWLCQKWLGFWTELSTLGSTWPHFWPDQHRSFCFLLLQNFTPFIFLLFFLFSFFSLFFFLTVWSLSLSKYGIFKHFFFSQNFFLSKLRIFKIFFFQLYFSLSFIWLEFFSFIVRTFSFFFFFFQSVNNFSFHSILISLFLYLF